MIVGQETPVVFIHYGILRFHKSVRWIGKKYLAQTSRPSKSLEVYGNSIRLLPPLLV
jgi:hypothetical protein